MVVLAEKDIEKNKLAGRESLEDFECWELSQIDTVFFLFSEGGYTQHGINFHYNSNKWKNAKKYLHLSIYSEAESWRDGIHTW